MSKIDIIIDALSVAQNSVWSALNEQALAAARELQAEKQEPVAWLHPDKKVDVVVPTSLTWFDKPLPLYTAPPRKKWVGLTDQEVSNLWFDHGGREKLNGYDFAQSISAKLKEKNGV